MVNPLPSLLPQRLPRLAAFVATCSTVSAVLLLCHPAVACAQRAEPIVPSWSISGHAAVASTGRTTADIRDGEVRDMVLKGDSISVRYKNTGTVATDIIGEIQIRDDAGEIVAAVLLADSLTVRAGATLRFRAAMPQLPKGHYTLYAVFDFGGDTMTAAEARLEIR